MSKCGWKLDTTLNDADLHGVALAAIQGLNRKLDEARAENAELRNFLNQLEHRLGKLASVEEQHTGSQRCPACGPASGRTHMLMPASFVDV